MFWLKPKKLVVDCFTTNEAAFSLAKPDHAVKFFPDWWKNTPHFYIDDGRFFKLPTIRKCAGIIEQYKHGLIIPMWCDLNIEVGPIGTTQYRWQFSDGQSEMHSHNLKQINNYLDEKEIVHCKFISPWYLKCKEEVMWSLSSPTWNLLKNRDFTILPGMSEFKYQHSTHINCFVFRKEKTFVIDIPYMTPVLHVVPLDDRKIKLKYHLISEEEKRKNFLTLNSKRVSFIKSYYNLRRHYK